MLRNHGLLVAALTALTGLSGCGTILNLEERPHFTCQDLPLKTRQIYGGTQLDAVFGTGLIKGTLTEPLDPEMNIPQKAICRFWGLSLGTYILAVDLPFSLVADTLTLPQILTGPPGHRL